MNSKSLRRLAADHGSLHTAGLPPNYLFPPSTASDPASDLTTLDILLAGPPGTPYAKGVWRLRLDIPPTYPTAPPTATFRTRMWHPNVDESTGAVCVETLKRDWVSTLKLRDVLVTISCLLIQPNPASALNESAGQLASEDWDGFCRRARLMTDIHAAVPANLAEEVREAQIRGEEQDQSVEKEVLEGDEKSGGTALGKQAESETSGDGIKAIRGLQAEEDEENRRKRGDTAEPESDPESDWIPGPTKSPRVLPTTRDNIFGIRGLDASMQLDTSPSKFSARSTKPALEDHRQDSIDSLPFITVPVKHHAQIEPTSSSTPKPIFSDENPFSVIEPNDDTNPLFKEFSWSWVDSEILHDSDTIKDGPSKSEVRKRMASDDFERRQKWERKMFKRSGYDLLRFNRGDFGPRTGLHRL